MFRKCSQMSSLTPVKVRDIGRGISSLEIGGREGHPAGAGVGWAAASTFQGPQLVCDLLANCQLGCKSCCCLTMQLSAEGGGRILAWESVLVPFRSALLGFGARVSVSARKMMSPSNKAARAGAPLLEQMRSDQCNAFFIWTPVICSNISAFVLPTSAAGRVVLL